uniref:Uncharacterized protein n=1 Tax=Medicago truncatula TaxID=3880 RepID=I3SFQ9_MEDTR|nr:unknown [Medicago truncatula]
MKLSMASHLHTIHGLTRASSVHMITLRFVVVIKFIHKSVLPVIPCL